MESIEEGSAEVGLLRLDEGFGEVRLVEGRGDNL